MVTLPVTLGDPNRPNHPISTFCVAIHIFVVGKHRNFKFGVQVDHSSKSQQVPAYGRQTVPAWSRHVTHFKFLVP